MDLSGNISLHGRVVAESTENTAGSVVNNRRDPLLTQIGGGVSIRYDSRLERSLVTSFRPPIRSWRDELPSNLSATGGP